MRNRTGRKPITDMNVVPFIDVMLVLLVIFMAVAPILTLGVIVDLPPADAEAVPPENLDDPLIVTIAAGGELFVNIGGGQESDRRRAGNLVSDGDLAEQARRVLKVRPDTPVLIHGDAALPYGRALQVMALLQKAGAQSVGLISNPPDGRQ